MSENINRMGQERIDRSEDKMYEDIYFDEMNIGKPRRKLKLENKGLNG
jgi:hypothetical protein